MATEAPSRLDPYGKLDAYWKAVADFIRPRLAANERLITPSPLPACFPAGQCSSYDEELSGKYQWVALHKGRLVEAEARGLLAACLALAPVFANEVFVLFASRGRGQALAAEDKHYQSFLGLLTNEFVPARLAQTKALVPAAPPPAYNAGAKNFALSAAEIVRSLYRKILGHEADPAKLQASTLKLTQEGKLDGVPTELMASNGSHHDVAPLPQPIYLGDHRALTRTRHGQQMYVDTRDLSLAPHLLLEGHWESWVTAEFLKHVQPGATVIEVGANMGYYTLLAAARVGPSGKVIALEANPDLCELVFGSIEINGFLQHCEILNKAVTEKAGAVTMRRRRVHMGSTSIAHFDEADLKRNYDWADEIDVESIALDDFIAERGLAQVDLIKIDAEGSEPLIFKGLENTLAKAKNLTIIFELSHMSQGLGFDVLGMLEGFVKKGFTLARIESDGLIPIKSLPEALSWSQCDILLQKTSPP